MFGHSSTAQHLYNTTNSAISRGMSTTANQFMKFNELSPFGQPPGAKLRAKIISKFPPKAWEKNGRSGKLLGLVISDGESKTKATIFSGVDEFDARVQQGKTYAFSNFAVRTPANMQYHNFSFPYEINFSEQTTYEEVDDAINIDLRTVRTVPLDIVVANLKAFAVRAQNVAPGARVPADPLFNVLGVLVGASELNSFTSKRGKALTKRDIEVVDGSMTKIKITLWGDVAAKCTEELAATHPVVLIQGLNFNSFSNTTTISSDFDAIIDYNPDTEASKSLAKWYQTEGSASAFIEMPSASSAAPSRSVLISSIVDDEILTFPDRTFDYTITGSVIAIRKPLSAAEANDENSTRRGSELYYNACSSCKKKVPEDSFSSSCPSCNAPLTVTKRYIMSFAFADGSGQRWITAFADEAEKIIGCSADELAAYRSTDPDHFDRILADATHRAFTMKVRAKVDQRDQNYEMGPRIRLTVATVNPVDYPAMIDEKMADIQDMMNHNFDLNYIY